MEIIGYDNNWALVCPNCGAIVRYSQDEIIEEQKKDKYIGGTYRIVGLHCPGCSHFLEEKHRRRIIRRANLNENSYYFAAADNRVIIV